MRERFDIMMKRLPNFDSINFDSDWRWNLLDKLYSENYAKHTDKKDKPKIPKKIHQIWLGSKFPSRYQFWADSWKELNPGYEYRLWTEDDVDEILTDRKTYDSLINYGPKSDLLRYHILNKFGGIYIDTDFECLRSFNDLSYLEFYTGVGYPSEVELYPGLIACTASNPIIQEVVKEINKVEQNEVKRKGPLETTSSYFFTRVFFDTVKEYRKGVVAFPPDYFYPFPNFSGHASEEGTKYIKECSYAIHYWEVSWNARKAFDWVQGFKFVRMADSVYAPNKFARDDYAKYPNTFDPTDLKPVNFVYTNIMYLTKLLKIVEYLPQKFVIISHNGDQHPEKGVIGTFNNGKKISEEPYSLPDNVIKLYVTNVDVVDPRIDTVPLGLENEMWGTEKTNIIFQLRTQRHQKKGLVYMNHALNTNYDERIIPYNLFSHVPWCTTQQSKGNRHGLTEYYHNMATHKFVMNPPGNCFDNHRMWEAWYLGCIPISKRSIFISMYSDMPMVIIDDWKEVTEDFLNREYERISKMEWDIDKLTFLYWRNKIRAIK